MMEFQARTLKKTIGNKFWVAVVTEVIGVKTVVVVGMVLPTVSTENTWRSAFLLKEKRVTIC